MKALLLLALVPVMSYAANVPPGFDAAKFRDLIATAGAKGDISQADQGLEYRTLTYRDPADTSKPHKAEYFSAVGAVNPDGHFGSIEVSVESEDWRKRANGDWEIEQWNWTAWPDGTLVKLWHSLLVETTDGRVLDIEPLPMGDPADAAELARWGNKVSEWYGYAGQR